MKDVLFLIYTKFIIYLTCGPRTFLFTQFGPGKTKGWTSIDSNVLILLRYITILLVIGNPNSQMNLCLLRLICMGNFYLNNKSFADPSQDLIHFGRCYPHIIRHVWMRNLMTVPFFPPLLFFNLQICLNCSLHLKAKNLFDKNLM